MKKTRKFLLVIACTLATLGFSAMSASCGAYEMTGFIVEGATVQKEYTVGDVVDFSGVEMYTTWTDNTQQDLTIDSGKVKVFLDGLEITDFSKITAKEGTYTLGFKFSDKLVEFEIVVNAIPAPPQLQTVSVNHENVDKEYVVGDTVTLEGLVVTANYDKGEPKNIPLNDANLVITCDGVDVTQNLNAIAMMDNAKEVTKTIKVKYNAIESKDFFTVHVVNPLTGISVSTSAMKTNYNVGETVDFSTIATTAIYKNAMTENVAFADVKFYLGNVEVSDLNTLTATVGAKAITVKYQDKTANFNINVNNYVTGISLNTTGVGLNYVAGEDISANDFANVKVNVQWADMQDVNAVKELNLFAEGVNVTSQNQAVTWENITAIAGDVVLTVTYANKTASFTVSVAQGDTAIETLSIVSNPTTTSYVAGADVSLDGLKIKAKYKEENGGLEEEIAYADFANEGVALYVGTTRVDNVNVLAQVQNIGENNVQVTVSYNGQTVNFNLTVTNSVKALNLDASQVKTQYQYGEIADFENISGTAVLDYGTVNLTKDNVQFFVDTTQLTSGTTNMNYLGVTQIIVKFGGQQTTFYVEVSDWVKSIAASGTTTFECAYGSTGVNFDGLVITATYASGATETVTDYQVNYADKLSTLGDHNLTVTYNEKTTTITLTVYDVLESIEIVSGIPQNLVYGSIVNLKKLVVNGKYKSGATTRIDLLTEGGEFLPLHVVFELKDGDNWTVITNDLNAITGASQTQVVRLSFTDEYGNTASVEFNVEVGEALPGVDEYSMPTALTNFKDRLANATNDESATNFESNYYVKEEKDYLVGDDNVYTFLPVLSQVDFESGSIQTISSFYADTTIWMMVENEYVQLSKTKDGNTFTYSYNGTPYVTENYGKNTYDFKDAAINNKFRLSVLPDAEKFDFETDDIDAAVTEFKVVDGYNVTKPQELCLLEQTAEAQDEDERRTDWNEIKASLGLTGVRPNAIILHKDLQITTQSIPESLYYTLPESYEVYYKYTENGVTYKVKPEDVPVSMGGPLTRDFLYNQLDGNYAIFEYYLKSGETFTIYGNYFDLDASKMPYVASFEPKNVSVAPSTDLDYSLYYGGDFSNTSLIAIFGVEGTTDATDEHFYFSNFAVKSNAMNKQLLTDESTSSSVTCADNPVYPGGLIFLKMQHLTGNVDNVRANHCFIAYFPDRGSVINLNNCKAYDCSQNAMYVWGDTTANVTNSNMKRAGGPLIIMNCEKQNDGSFRVPVLTIDDASVMESFVTGQEQWFATVNATPQVQQLQVLDYGIQELTNGFATNEYLKQCGVTGNKKTLYKDGKLNVVVAFLGASGIESATDATNRGYISYGNCIMDRLPTGSMYMPMLGHMMAGRPYVINLGANVIASDGAAFFNNSGTNVENAITAEITTVLGGGGAPGETMKTAQAFIGNEYKHLTLNWGGLGLVLGYFDA